MPERVTASVSVYSPEEQLRERRCQNWRECHCSHQQCMDGFLDEEAEDPKRPGKMLAVRCPHCYDTVLMLADRAEDSTPPWKRKR